MRNATIHMICNQQSSSLILPQLHLHKLSSMLNHHTWFLAYKHLRKKDRSYHSFALQKEPIMWNIIKYIHKFLWFFQISKPAPTLVNDTSLSSNFKRLDNDSCQLIWFWDWLEIGVISNKLKHKTKKKKCSSYLSGRPKCHKIIKIQL